MAITYDKLTHYLSPTIAAWATHKAIANIVIRGMFFMICFVPACFVCYVCYKKS
ncbi:MAG: hypothetical protein Q4A69_05385 [Moraxella sp.]|nr:hypothetical protein [Moraxella sp.]